MSINFYEIANYITPGTILLKLLWESKNIPYFNVILVALSFITFMIDNVVISLFIRKYVRMLDVINFCDIQFNELEIRR